ncbi:MAG: hypothetical protein HQL70_08950 [Magnetococcales bacterium]|nr:hypothetical protein [Magnetococcales bacterium]
MDYRGRKRLDSKLQQLVVRVVAPLCVLMPVLVIAGNSKQLPIQTNWGISTQVDQNYAIMDLDSNFFNARQADNRKFLNSTIELELHTNSKPLRKKRKSVTIYRKIMENQPDLAEWVDPWIDTGESKAKSKAANLAIKWNPSRPDQAVIKARPFHAIKMIAPGFQKIEISKRLIGDADDLRACYRINNTTSAELVKENGRSAILLNYSSPF